jgi:hypothetical protein
MASFLLLANIFVCGGEFANKTVNLLEPLYLIHHAPLFSYCWPSREWTVTQIRREGRTKIWMKKFSPFNITSKHTRALQRDI